MSGPTLDKVGDVFPDEGNTLTVRVCPDRTDLSLKFLCPSDDIRRDGIFC